MLREPNTTINPALKHNKINPNTNTNVINAGYYLVNIQVLLNIKMTKFLIKNFSQMLTSEVTSDRHLWLILMAF